MQPSPEVTLDLTAPELLDQDLSAPADLVEVNDICEVDPLLRTDSFAASAGPLPDPTDDSVEIELTAEQMQRLLDGAG